MNFDQLSTSELRGLVAQANAEIERRQQLGEEWVRYLVDHSPAGFSDDHLTLVDDRPTKVSRCRQIEQGWIEEDSRLRDEEAAHHEPNPKEEAMHDLRAELACEDREWRSRL